MHRKLVSRLVLGSFLAAPALGKWTPPYKNAQLSPEQRADDLVARMTLEDKMAQLMQGTYQE